MDLSDLSFLLVISKMGEGSLLHQWFDHGVMASLLEEHHSARLDHSKRIYALVMLAVWTAKG